jgi:hypothetical protein
VDAALAGARAAAGARGWLRCVAAASARARLRLAALSGRRVHAAPPGLLRAAAATGDVLAGAARRAGGGEDGDAGDAGSDEAADGALACTRSAGGAGGAGRVGALPDAMVEEFEAMLDEVPAPPAARRPPETGGARAPSSRRE